MMKTLLLLCVSATLVQVAILKDAYLKTHIPNHSSPQSSNDFLITITVFHLDHMTRALTALDDPNGEAVSTDGAMIWVDDTSNPPNLNIPVLNSNFSNPDVTKDIINGFVSGQTSGKIKDLIGKVNPYTVAIMASTVGSWKLWDEDTKGWTAPLSGNYNMVEDKDMGVTLIEKPYNDFVSVIFAIPDPGREEEVDKNLTPAAIDALRKSMTQQSVSKEIAKVTLYAACFQLVEKIPLGSNIYTRRRSSYEISAVFG